MMTPFADLHCHTTFSDGSATPDEILALAIEKGFKGVSITDHDNVSAYQGLEEKAKRLQLELITGVEFSCGHKGSSVHILGYAFQIDAPPLVKLIEHHKSRRAERNRAILANLAKKQMAVTEEEIQALGGAVIGRPHIAQVMVQKGYVGSVQEAFRKYLGEGRACYAPGTAVSVEESIAVIQASGGKAVIAHPHLVENPKIFQDLLQMPFNGIECYYALFGPEKNRRYVDLASRKGWLETGGSDFHGTIKPMIPYGASYVDESRFRQLQQ